MKSYYATRFQVSIKAKLQNIRSGYDKRSNFTSSSILINILPIYYLNFQQFQIILILNKLKPLQMLHYGITNTHLVFQKIHFTVRKRVRFGQAVYVCGNVPELGNWNPDKAFRLRWNQGDLWTSSLLLTASIPDNIQYKYIIADWDNSWANSIQWQVGAHNRKMDLGLTRSTTICDDKWNMDRVCLYLLAVRAKSSQEQKYYVTGDISELGYWKQKKLMKKVIKKNISFNGKRDYLTSCKSNSNQELQLYSYSFYTFRGKQQFYYYYIRKTDVYQSERKPGRILKFNEQDIFQHYRREVNHMRGEIGVVDESNFNGLIFSKITNNIYVGSYLKSSKDIVKLKEQNITAILSIQSQRDFNSHGLTPHYLSLLCEEHQIKYKRYAIEDMNNQDFVYRADGAVRMMSELLKDGGKVYVHCSAGIYRSPQIIALYLSIFHSYPIEDAVNMIKAKHPYAKPNPQVISDALGVMRMRQVNRRLGY